MKSKSLNTVIVIVSLFFAVACSEYSQEQDSGIEENPDVKDQSPIYIGELLVKNLLAREDYMMYVTDDFTGIHYAEAAMGYAALKFVNVTNNEELLHALEARYQQVPGTDDLINAGHVDANVYGILPLQFYLTNTNEEKLQEGLQLADAQWLNPGADGLTKQARYWIDDIWMVNSLQLQAYRATHKPIYLDRAALLTEKYLRELQQENGLFYHGKNAHFFWGRGNGWVAAGLAELLSELPAEHEKYAFIEGRYIAMMDALLRYQAEDGMWRQLVDREEAWKETSATAMFGFAMVIGVKRGILPAQLFTASYQKAWSALTTYVDEQGRLAEVCVGTGQSQDINYYLERPRSSGDFHGQAPLLWFAGELL